MIMNIDLSTDTEASRDSIVNDFEASRLSRLPKEVHVMVA
jgi:hypothetical protein